MAALPAGVQYGLSSKSGHDENKDLVFVKLTDSALRAIEDFLRNKGKFGTTPTIQFLPGNEGKISIPASGGGGQQAAATFHFSLSSNADMEGPQGSFECARGGGMPGARRLDACGPMPSKMRIHAKEDVYEATRHRMTADAEHLKSKCARVIKPNQTDIGRKVKVRQSLGAVRPLVRPVTNAAVATRPTPSPSSLPTAIASAPITNASPTRLTHPAAQPPTRPQPSYPLSHPIPYAHHQPRQAPLPGNPDIMKRPIKERLIQLLALRPYKKPELYSRITSEGIKDRERSVIKTVLQQISCLRDNCYHLYRYLWNDVNEDWPFYTEEERQILKRRKPQNLTPPLSSDSGHSGQSPSPRGSPSQASKRQTTTDAGQPHTKKQRISHYRKPTTPTQTQTGFIDNNNLRRGGNLCSSPSGQGLSSGISSGSSSGASSGERRAYSDDEPSHPPSRDHGSYDKRNGEAKKDNGYTLSFVTAKDFCPSPVKNNGFRPSPPEDQVNCFRPSPPGNQTNGFRPSPTGNLMNGFRPSPPVNRVVGFRPSPSENQVNGFRPSPPENQVNGFRPSPPGNHVNGFRPSPPENQVNGFRPSPPENLVNGYRPNPLENPVNGFRPSPPENQINNFRPSPPENQISSFRPSPSNDQITADQQNDRRVEMETDHVSDRADLDNEAYFNSQFPPIDSFTTRRMYKTEFAKLYAEYCELHKRVSDVASTFYTLEARLKQAPPGSSMQRVVQKQIVDEYKATQRNMRLQRDKNRFTYLHRKLAHIKRRVADYDNKHMSTLSATSSDGPAAQAEAY